jgi:hypothetical protein
MEAAVAWLTEYGKAIFGAMGATIAECYWGSSNLKWRDLRGKAAMGLPHSIFRIDGFCFLVKWWDGIFLRAAYVSIARRERVW